MAVGEQQRFGSRPHGRDLKQSLARASASTRDDGIDDLYENNAFDNEDQALEAAAAAAAVRRGAAEPAASKPKCRGEDATATNRPRGNKVQFDVWVARKDKYERMARALAQLDATRAAADESWLAVAVALAATDCLLKTGKTPACNCDGVCRETTHSVTRQRTRCQCPTRKCSLCRRCVGTRPGAISPKMVAALEPYRDALAEPSEGSKAALELAAIIVRTGEGQSLRLQGEASARITTAAFRMAQTVLAQCSVLETPDGVKLQRPCECPVRSLGDLWVKWTTKHHTFSRVPLSEQEAQQFSSGTRQMMEQKKDDDGTMRYLMTLKWHAAAKPQKGDTAKIAARRMLTPDQKQQNAFFLGLCKKYWQLAQLRVAEHLQKTLTAAADMPQRGGRSAAELELQALNRLGVRRMLQWLEEDAEAVENARAEEAREKAEGGVVAHSAWVRRKDRLRIRLPSPDSSSAAKAAREAQPPRFDFSTGSVAVVRKRQPCRPPSSTAELMQHSGLKYVHAMSEGFQGRGGDLEKSRQLLVQSGHVLRANFDPDEGDQNDDGDPESRPFSKDRYLFERRNNPALRGKLEGNRRRREQSRESYAAWVAHKALRDKAVKFLEYLPPPREGEDGDLEVVDSAKDDSYEDDYENDEDTTATPTAVRWEEVGKALKAVDRTLLDAWVRWSHGFRGAGRCRALWESFAPVSCDVHCASSPLRDVFLKLLHRPSGVNYRQACLALCSRRHKQALARGDAVDAHGQELDEDLAESELLKLYGAVTGRELATLLRSLGLVLQPEETQRLVEFFADPEETESEEQTPRIKLEAFLNVLGDERRALCRGDTELLLRSVCMWETVCHECGMLNAFQLVLGTEGSSNRRRAELPGHVRRREQSGGRFTCCPESEMTVVRREAPRLCSFAQWDDTQAAPFLKKLALWSAAPREQHVLRELVTSGLPPGVPALVRDDDEAGDALDPTTMLHLRWQTPEGGGGGAPAFYQLETAGAEGSASFRVSSYHEICRDPKDFADNDGAPRGAFTVTGLTPNTKYAFRVRALNGFGAGAYAFAYFVTAPARPAEPLAVAVAAHSVKLAWESSSYYARRLRELEEVFREADADGNGRISRDEFMEEIERRKPKLVAFLQQTTAASETGAGAAATSPLSVFDAIETDDNESLSWDEFLRFFHGALDLSETASRSSRGSARFSRSSKSSGRASRTSLSGSASSRSLQKTSKRTTAATAKPSVCRFILKQCSNEAAGEYVEIYRGAAPRFEVLGLHSGSTYQFRVQAVNAEGRTSLHSEAVVVNTLLPTPAPPTLEPAVQSNALQLRWAMASARPSLSPAALRAPKGADDHVARLLKEWAQETSLDDGAVDFKARFDRYDADGSGYLELPEFQTLLRELGVPPTPERLAAYLAAFDLDGDGKISFPEFARWWTQPDVQYVLKRDAGRRESEDPDENAEAPSQADEMRLVCYRGTEAAAAVGGLEPNTRYRFRLRLVGAHASSALSEALSVCTAPSAPTCAGRVDVGCDSALVRWHPGSGGAARYAVDCKRIETLTPKTASSNDGPGEWRRVYEGREPLAFVRGLQADTVYRLRVFALNSDGLASAQSTVSQLCMTSNEEAQRRSRLARRPAGVADYFTVECGPEEGDLVLGDTVLFCERLMRSSNDVGRTSGGASGLAQASVYSTMSASSGSEAVGERTVAAKVVGISRHPRHGNVLALTVVWSTVQLYNIETSATESRRGGTSKRRTTSSSVHTPSHELTSTLSGGYALAADLKISRRERSLYRFDTFRAEWEDEAARYPSTWEK